MQAIRWTMKKTEIAIKSIRWMPAFKFMISWSRLKLALFFISEKSLKSRKILSKR